jgi:hypothetical protein
MDMSEIDKHSKELQENCGHPVTAIVSSGEGTNYCSMCEDEPIEAKERQKDRETIARLRDIPYSNRSHLEDLALRLLDALEKAEEELLTAEARIDDLTHSRACYTEVNSGLEAKVKELEVEDRQNWWRCYYA